MHSHVVLLGEINVTTVAVEWCFSSVDPFMQSQVVTMVANEWFLSSVNTIMHSQVVLLDEFLVTVVAVEWLFTSVNPFMHSQVVLLNKLLFTVVAVEWFLSSVIPIMLHSQVRLPFWTKQWWKLNGFSPVFSCSIFILNRGYIKLNDLNLTQLQRMNE